MVITNYTLKKTAVAISFTLMSGASLAQQAPQEGGEGVTDIPPDVEIPEAKQTKNICLDDKVNEVENFVNNLIPDVCANIETDKDVQDSGLAHENENAGCDLGLEMPGLPSFNGTIGFGGIDTCSMVQNVTGDMVDSANDKMSQEMGNVNEFLDDEGVTDFDLDFTEMTKDAAQGL